MVRIREFAGRLELDCGRVGRQQVWLGKREGGLGSRGTEVRRFAQYGIQGNQCLHKRGRWVDY